MPTKTVRRKRCSECNELKAADEVLGNQNICEQCEQDMDYCTVCNEFFHDTTNHRHLKWLNGVGLCGCGSYTTPDQHKESFLILLRVFRKQGKHEYDYKTNTIAKKKTMLLPQMAKLLEANNLWTQWYGPLIGGPPSLTLYYEKEFPEHKSTLSLHTFHPEVQMKWGNKKIDAMQLGMAWLTSLAPDSTDSNQLTAKWIREFLIRRQL